MYIYNKGNYTEASPSVATIGFFDGVHKGHQFLLDGVKRIAEQQSLASMAITFAVHPRKVLHDSYQPQLLTTNDEKLDRLSSTGIIQVAVLDFSMQMAQLTAMQFMRDVLHDMLNVKVLVIGYDHRFGHNREEGFEQYVQYGKEIGIDVVQASVCTVDEYNVSSSVVRCLLEKGDVAEAKRCLGYAYSIAGEVVHGFKLGRTMGFPTANINMTADKMLPKEGVYAVAVYIQGKTYCGMLNIGRRPTMDNGNNVSIEVHIIGWQSDLYGTQISIEFIDRVRDEQKFNSVDELKKQLKRDSDLVTKMFEKYT